jgi:hypothetical protein
MDAGRLIAGGAVRARIVRSEERSYDELADLDVTNLSADLSDDARIFVTDRCRSLDVFDTSIGPQVGSADTRGRKLNDGICSREDGRLFSVLDPHVSRTIHHGPAHHLCSMPSVHGS